jgi:hypothetical protein
VPDNEELARRFKSALGTLQPANSIVAQLSKEDLSSPSVEGEVKPTTINLFQHPDTHPVILDLALTKKYNEEWWEWEWEVLEFQIPKDFPTSSVSDLTMHKIEAMRTLHLNSNFWTRWEVFLWLTMPLNDLYPDFVVMQVPTLAQCLVSTEIADSVYLNHEWSQELLGYLEAAYRHDGIFCPVWPLEEVPIEVSGFVDQKEILSRWPEVNKSRVPPTGETVTDEQLRRMLVVTDYLEESRARLAAQLPLIRHA